MPRPSAARRISFAACPEVRHIAHPGYTCAEEDAVRARIVTYRGRVNLTSIPAAALAGTTFGCAG
ncbi:hypothetical protein [Streptomyces sp. NPDC021224]|uniref:hypothetical protein n=1 Tax=unclassified Streptomyces TaxID=2593676 RepID=UPI0037B41E52